jgi:hypothetical protein
MKVRHIDEITKQITRDDDKPVTGAYFIAERGRWEVKHQWGAQQLRELADLLDDLLEQETPAVTRPQMADDELDDAHPLWGINSQFKGLLEGEGATEDHEAVLAFLRTTGLPEGTVKRIHKAIVSAELPEWQRLTPAAHWQRMTEKYQSSTVTHSERIEYFEDMGVPEGSLDCMMEQVEGLHFLQSNDDCDLSEKPALQPADEDLSIGSTFLLSAMRSDARSEWTCNDIRTVVGNVTPREMMLTIRGCGSRLVRRTLRSGASVYRLAETQTPTEPAQP